MKEDQSKLIISIGIIISLIIITWTAMKWPLGFSNEYFWIFIVIAFIEAVIVIVVNEILKSKFKKKKKKKDNKKFQKANNILLIIIISLSSLLMLSVSGAIWVFSEINQYSKIYPSGTMTYSLDSYESELINRQALHSYKTSFIHPVSKKVASYIAPIPDDMLVLIKD